METILLSGWVRIHSFIQLSEHSNVTLTVLSLEMQAQLAPIHLAITTRTVVIWLHRYTERSAGFFIHRKTRPCWNLLVYLTKNQASTVALISNNGRKPKFQTLAAVTRTWCSYTRATCYSCPDTGGIMSTMLNCRSASTRGLSDPKMRKRVSLKAWSNTWWPISVAISHLTFLPCFSIPTRCVITSTNSTSKLNAFL